MKRSLYIALMGLIILANTGCGGGVSTPPTSTFTASIPSDSAYDGDIQLTTTNSYIVTQGMSPTVQSVFVGIGPISGTESRAFLDFPLGGAKGIPANAIIDSAWLDVYIKSILPTSGSIPVMIDLVTFQPPTLRNTDYDRNSLLSLGYTKISPNISQADVGKNVSVDVTTLMMEAQRRRFTDFQVRIMEDLGVNVPVLFEIDDTTGNGRQARAPLLRVTYH